MKRALNILITRPMADATPLADILRKKGHTPIIEPLLRIEFINTSVELADIQALLITSANGIRAFSKVSERRDIQVYTVGEASAREAESLGFVNVRSADGDVEALTKLVCKKCKKDKPLLHIAGNIQAGDLKGGLEKKGFEVKRTVLYSAEPASALSPQTIAGFLNCEFDAVLFYSPRTAEIFMHLAEQGRVGYLLKSARALCLSDAVSEIIKKGSWAEVITASEPDQNSLLSLIERI